MRETASRQLWSSLRAWLRKPQMVVIGLNSLSRKRTPCSSRAARILGRLREAAKGRPWSRAKRARTSSRVVIEWPRVAWGTPGGRVAAAAGDAVMFRCGAIPARREWDRLAPSFYARHPYPCAIRPTHEWHKDKGCSVEHELRNGWKTSRFQKL